MFGRVLFPLTLLGLSVAWFAYALLSLQSEKDLRAALASLCAVLSLSAASRSATLLEET